MTIDFESVSDTSLPIWERGLKQDTKARLNMGYQVAPYMGAWIETVHLPQTDSRY